MKYRAHFKAVPPRLVEANRAEVEEVYYLTMPYSEVCMHMGIAGKKMYAKILEREEKPVAAQLFDENKRPFSSPVTTGEAGFYEDEEGFYFYRD